MSKFKVGDVVCRVKGAYLDIKIGDVSVVTGIIYDDSIKLKDFQGTFAANNFELHQAYLNEMKLKKVLGLID